MHCSTHIGLSDHPRIVLDSNVVLDWLVFGDPGVAPLQRAIEGRQAQWIVSDSLRAELAHVIGRGVVSAWSPDLATLWGRWQHWAQNLPDLATAGAASHLRCRDTDDQKFIDLALVHGARWLVSRDKAVLALARRALPLGLTICTPERWAVA